MNRFTKLYMAGILGLGTLLGVYERAYQPIAKAAEIPRIAYNIKYKEKQFESLESHVRENTQDAVPKARYVMPSPVHAEMIEQPSQSYISSQNQEQSRWNLFEGNIPFDSPPSYVDPISRSPFEIEKPKENGLTRKLKNLMQKEIYKKVRSEARKQLKEQFKEMPSMSHSFYEKRMSQINTIGRDIPEADSLDSVYTNEIKTDVFGEKYDVENEMPLFGLGPLTLTDAGNLRFDFGSIANLENTIDDVEVFDKPRTSVRGESWTSKNPTQGFFDFNIGEKAEKIPLITSDKFRFNTDFNVSFHPERVFQSGEVLSTIPSYSFKFEVDTVSDILKKRMASAELEIKIKNNEEVSAFLNFVIKSRK